MKKGKGSAGRMLVNDDLYSRIEDQINKVDSVLANIESATARMPALIEEAEKRVKEIKGPLTELDKALKGVPEIMHTVQRELEEVSTITQAVKDNFLIRRYLPPAPKEKTISVEGRGR